MAISNYYTQTFQLYTNTETQDSSGAWTEVLVLEDTFLGILDPDPTTYSFSSDQKTYEFSDRLFTGINSNITEGKVIKFNNTEFDIVSVQDPLYRNHHLEVLLLRRSNTDGS